MKYKPFLLSKEKDMMYCRANKDEIGMPCDAYIKVDLRGDERAKIVTADDVVRCCFNDKAVYIGTGFDDAMMEVAERQIREFDEARIARDVKKIKEWCVKVSPKAVAESERLIRAIAEDAADEESNSLVGVADYIELPDFDKIEPFSIDENCAKGEGWYVINNPKDFNVYVIIYDIDDVEEYGYDGLTVGSLFTIDRYYKWNPYDPLYFGDKYWSENGLGKAKEYLRNCPKEVLRAKMLDRNYVLWSRTHREADESSDVSVRKRLVQEEKEMMNYIEEETAKGNYELYV